MIYVVYEKIKRKSDTAGDLSTSFVESYYIKIRGHKRDTRLVPK